MIVDDDRTTVSLLKTLLEMDGFEVVLVPRGAMVLEKALQEIPDIFLLDYHLADMEGTTVSQTLRADSHFATTPIVMSSGLNVESEAKSAGVNAFLVKPFDPSDLANILTKLLEPKPPEIKPAEPKLPDKDASA
jgi:DNA-binding response OmpR family regulator